jgi:hypothetical protein
MMSIRGLDEGFVYRPPGLRRPAGRSVSMQPAVTRN